MSIANLSEADIPTITAKDGIFESIFCQLLDANASLGGTLFVGTGPSFTTSVQIGAPSGTTVVLPGSSGLLCANYSRGSILGPGPISIGTDDVQVTGLFIGSAARPMVLRASGLSLPTAGVTPYVISESQAQQNTVMNYTGAIVSAGAVNVSLRRIGNWVDVNLRQIGAQSVTVGGQFSIIIAGALPVNYRPLVSNRDFVCNVYNNSANNLSYVSGNIRITTGGNIEIYRQNGFADSWDITGGGNNSGINSTCISFDVTL